MCWCRTAAKPGRSWGPEAWEKMTCSPPKQIFVDTAELSSRKVEQIPKRRSTEVTKECQTRSKYSNRDSSVAARRAYSRHDEDISPSENGDLSPQHLDELKDSFYRTNISLSGKEAQKLEEETREQSGSEIWIRLRCQRRRGKCEGLSTLSHLPPSNGPPTDT